MNQKLGRILDEARYVILVVLVTTMTIGFAYAFQGRRWPAPGERPCQWTDSYGHDLGIIVTFSPPDTPDSLGYCCGGSGCVYWSPEGGLWRDLDCVTSPPLDEGEGVYSQLCECEPPPF